MFHPLNVNKRENEGDQLFCRMPQKFPAAKSKEIIEKLTNAYMSRGGWGLKVPLSP